MGKAATEIIIPPYKKAFVYIGDDDRYVEFSYWSKNKKKYLREKVRIKEKFIPTATKEVLLPKLCQQINALITQRNKSGTYHEDVIGTSVLSAHKTLHEWVQVASLNERDFSADMRSNLTALTNILTQFVETYPHYRRIIVPELNDDFFEDLIQFFKESGRAGKTINKYLLTITTLSTWLHRKKIIPASISTEHLRVKQPKNETGRFPPLTEEEKVLAFSYFRERDPAYYLFLLFMYYTCIRPAELQRLKVGNIDIKGRKILVPWYDSKNGLSNYVQVFDPLAQAIQDMNVLSLPSGMYLFSKKCQPGYEHDESNYTSDYWSLHRPKMGMPKSKQLYGFKHTFNIDYVERNKRKVDWEWLRRHNRHATVQQTQAYISGLTAYFLDETKNTIINYHTSPGMGPKSKK